MYLADGKSSSSSDFFLHLFEWWYWGSPLNYSFCWFLFPIYSNIYTSKEKYLLEPAFLQKTISCVTPCCISQPDVARCIFCVCPLFIAKAVLYRHYLLYIWWVTNEGNRGSLMFMEFLVQFRSKSELITPCRGAFQSFLPIYLNLQCFGWLGMQKPAFLEHLQQFKHHISSASWNVFI